MSLVDVIAHDKVVGESDGLVVGRDVTNDHVGAVHAAVGTKTEPNPALGLAVYFGRYVRTRGVPEETIDSRYEVDLVRVVGCRRRRELYSRRRLVHTFYLEVYSREVLSSSNQINHYFRNNIYF